MITTLATITHQKLKRKEIKGDVMLCLKYTSKIVFMQKTPQHKSIKVQSTILWYCPGGGGGGGDGAKTFLGWGTGGLEFFLGKKIFLTKKKHKKIEKKEQRLFVGVGAGGGGGGGRWCKDLLGVGN